MLNQHLSPTTIFAYLLFFLITPHSLAKSSPTKIQSIPLSIQNQICRDLSPDKKACGTDDKVSYIRSFKLDNNQVLLFFFLKDKENRYHRSLTLPVKLNLDGQWITGSSFVGEPHKIVRSAVKTTKGIWMHAQFNASGKNPRLLHSKEGLDWTEISLPIDGKSSYQLEDIKNLCIHNDDVFLTLQSIDKGDTSTFTSWKTHTNSILKLTTKGLNKTPSHGWEKIDSKLLSPSVCASKRAINNSWVVQGGETMTLLQYDAKELVVKIPYSVVVKSPVAKKVDNSATFSAISPKVTKAKKNYVVQVGAYNELISAKNIVSVLQKAGFKSYSEVLDNKGNKTNKIYMGPYEDRKEATKKLAELKVKFSKNKAIQSAFIVHLR